jgi:transposase
MMQKEYSQEVIELIHLYKDAQTGKDSRRYHAVLLFKLNKKVIEIAELLFADEETIRLWLSKWEQEHVIQDKQRPGKPRTLTKEEEDILCRLVEENKPEDHGYNIATWDCVALQIYVRDHFDKTVSDESIRKILINNGFHYKKINYLFSKRDETIRNQFVNELIGLYEANMQNTDIMFCDEASTKLHPKPGYVWTRDEKAFVQTLCSHKRLNTIAAIEPLLGATVHESYEKNNADSFVAFLETLQAKTKKNIVLVLDNYGVHKSKKVKDYLAQPSCRINLKFLPTYSPDLNPIEWLWGYARKKYLNSRACKTLEELRTKLDVCFDSISSEKIKEICSLRIIEKHLII